MLRACTLNADAKAHRSHSWHSRYQLPVPPLQPPLLLLMLLPLLPIMIVYPPLPTYHVDIARFPLAKKRSTDIVGGELCLGFEVLDAMAFTQVGGAAHSCACACAYACAWAPFWAMQVHCNYA